MHTYAPSLLDYCSRVFSSGNFSNFRLAESVKRHFTKRVYDLKPIKLRYSDRLEVLSLDFWDMRRIISDVMYLYELV